MARLDREELEILKHQIQESKHPWLFAALDSTKEQKASLSLEGALGYFDWRLHGQVSNLVKKRALTAGTITMIPAQQLLGRSNLLIYSPKKTSGDANPDEVNHIVNSLKGLKVQEVCFVDSTWPGQIHEKLKKALIKAKIISSSLGEKVERK